MSDVYRPYETNRNNFRYLVEFIWAGSTVDEILTDDDEIVDSLTSGANEDLYDVRVTSSDRAIKISLAPDTSDKPTRPTDPQLLARIGL